MILTRIPIYRPCTDCISCLLVVKFNTSDKTKRTSLLDTKFSDVNAVFSPLEGET